MAEDVMVKDYPCNSCCQTWKEKYTKLKERCSKYENGRNALREAISILEHQISNLQAENRALKKASDDERARAESEKEEKGKESAVRVFLENEVAALKSEILSLQENGGLVGRGVNEEVASLQLRISEAETEITQLKELLQRQRKRVAEEKEKVEMERKKAEKALEKVKAELKKASEEKRLTDIERKKDQEFRLRFETLKCEADEARSKLALETAKYEEEMKKLKAEKEISKKERECADKEMAKAEDLQKLVEANRKKAMDERSRADHLSQQLDQNKRRLEKLEKEFLKHASTRKLVKIPGGQPVEDGQSELAGEVGSGTMSKETIEAFKKCEEMEQKLLRVKKQARSEMKKAEEQIRVAEAYKSKAMEEKNRADDLSSDLEGNKQRMEKIRNEIQELVSSVKVFESFDPASGGSLQEATAEIKLLRKKLKFEKMRVKHANEVSKMEMDRNQILRREVHRIKQDFLQFSQRFDILDKCLFVESEGINDLEKMGSLNLEQEGFHVQSSLMIPHSENEFVKPSSTSSIVRGGSGPVKQNNKSNVLLPPVSGHICKSPITGTDSSLELLLRGSNRKMLQTSAINSSSASFSDRPLVGSQEKGTFSVTTSALLAEEQNLEPTTSSFSDDARKGYDEKLGVGAENSVGSPMKSGATERSGRHRKRKRLPDAVESIEKLYSAGQRWHQQVLQKLSVLHGMLNGESLKSLEEEKLLVPKIQGDLCSKLVRPHKKKKASNIGVEMLHATELKTKLETLYTEISEVCKNTSTTECDTNAPELTDIRDDLLGTRCYLERDFEVSGLDYMKLVDLDNDDEKHFRKAIEEPVSPLSPTLCNVQFPCTEAAEIEMHTSGSSPGFSGVQENVMPPCNFDVINIEIDSNERTLESLGSYKCLSFRTCEPHNDSKKNLDHGGSGNSDMMSNGFSGQIQNSSMLLVAPRDENLTCECRTSVCTRFPKYCVVSSNNIESSSIYRIFHTCSGIMSQFSGSCSIERLIQNILLSLQNADGLSAGEWVSVFLSLLLHYIPETAIGAVRSFSDVDFLQLMDCIGQQWSAVLNDVATKRMFLESCDVGELLALIENFLLNRTILVYGDVSHRMMHGGDPEAKAFPNDKSTFWSIAAASSDLLFVGGLLLASICVSLDQIGFICEISYSLFSSRKIDISFLLKLLHVFAHLCGPKFFTLEDYDLEMSVLKSLVVFLERLNSSSTDKFSCLCSVDEKLVKISACATCPFLEDVASVDFVVSLLLEKLQSYTFSGGEKQEPRKAQLSPNSVPVFHEMKTANVSCHGETGQMNFVSNQYLYCFIDILSLVELVASFMTWDWTFGNIVSQLLKILDSYIPENIFPAVIALLGQLGRIGVDAKGYEDSQVDSLRNWLVGFQHRNTFRSYGLPIQFASVTALIGLVARSFEEVVETCIDSPPTDSQSVAVDCVSEWFSSLTKEEQSSFRSLHYSKLDSNKRTFF